MSSNISKPDLVIYHGNCPDGVAGAWCFYKLLDKDINKFYPGKFNETIPMDQITDKNILFVDFTYRKATTEEMLKVAKSIVVLDHHKTALDLKEINNDKLNLILDMDRSGAQLAWDYVNNANNDNTKRPYFIDDIADRDLWKWLVPNSKETTRAMNSLCLFESIEKFSTVEFIPRSILLSVGTILVNDDQRIHDNICRYAIDCIYTSPVDNTTWKVRVAQASSEQASDIGNYLLKDKLCDFAVIYRYDLMKDQWFISLRAHSDSNVDLTDLCKNHFKQGGGHPKAAGIMLDNNKGLYLRSLFVPVPLEERFHTLQEKINKLSKLNLEYDKKIKDLFKT